MKVLLLNDVARLVGGAEVFTLELRDDLRARGHDARILASHAYLDGEPSPTDYTCAGSTSRLRTLNRVLNLRARRDLGAVLASFRPDVVHVRMFMSQLSPLILPLLRDIPCLYHASTYETICPTGSKLLPDREVCQVRAGVACRRCLSPQAWTVLMVQRRLWLRWRQAFDLVVANSDTMLRRLAESGIGPAVRIYNGAPPREARPPLSGPPVLAYAGRLAPEKGVDVLVRAFADVAKAHPTVRLLLIGDGPERDAVAHLVAAEQLGTRVTMTGHLTRRETETQLDRAWAQVMPSILEEPFGNAAAEALMRGTALVATALGGPAEIVRHGDTGILVPPGSTGDLARALTRLVSDRELAERLGAAGRASATDRLSRGGCIDRFESLYASLVESRRP